MRLRTDEHKLASLWFLLLTSLPVCGTPHQTVSICNRAMHRQQQGRWRHRMLDLSTDAKHEEPCMQTGMVVHIAKYAR